MAGEDFKNKIEFDVGDAGSALDRLAKQIDKYNVSVENLVRAEKVMNEQGKTTEINLKFLNDAGLTLTASLNKVKGGFSEVITGMTQVDNVAKRLADTERLAAKAFAETAKAIEVKRKNLEGLRVAQEAVAKANREANQAEQAQRALTGVAKASIGGRLDSATPAEISALNTAINKVVDSVQKGEFTLKEFQTTFGAVGREGEKALLGVGTALAKSVNQTRAALAAVGSEEAKLTAKTKEELEKRIAAEKAASDKRRKASRDGLAEQKVAEEKAASRKRIASILGLTEQKIAEEKEASQRRVAALVALAEQKVNEGKKNAQKRTASQVALIEQKIAEEKEASQRRVAALVALAEQKAAEEKEASQRRTASAVALAEQKVAEQKKASQRRAASAAALAEQRAATIEENRRNAAAGAVAGRLQTRPAGENLNLQQLIAVQATMARINALFTSGTVTLRDYVTVQRALANNTVSQLTPAQAQLAQSLRQLQAEYQGTAEAGRAAQRITLSVAGVMRLFVAAQVHRGINLLTNAFRDATFGAIDFGIAISEIQTVSLNSEKSFKSWSAEVTRLSNSFGIDTAKAAKATYEALSNQVIEGAQSFQFMAETAKFATVAVTSMEDAANLTSSAINSFGLNQSNAAKINAEFFKGIDLGRFTAEDLANTYGRTAQTANALGVSNAELLASLTVLTRAGVDAAEAQTLVGNLMLKLIKPTKEMKLLFDEWGVASGQAAIAAFGFGGVLSKLNDESLKGVNRTAELLNEYRSLRAGIGLAGDAFKAYGKDFAEIRDASTADYDEAFTKVMQTDAKKLQIEFNKLKNFFVQDFGTNFIKILRDVSDRFGGMVFVVKNTLNTFAGFTTAFITYRVLAANTSFATLSLAGAYRSLTVAATTATVATTRLALANRLLNASSLPLFVISSIVGIIAGRFANAALFAKDFASTVADAIAEAEEAASKFLAARIANEVKETQVVVDNLELRFRAFLQYASRVQAASNILVKEAEAANVKSAQSFKDYIDVLADQINKVVSRAEDRAKKLLDLVTKSKEKIAELQADGEKGVVDRNLAKTNDPAAQAGIIQAEIDRLSTLTLKAAEDYKNNIAAANALRAAGDLEGASRREALALADLQNAEALTVRQKELADQLFRLRTQQLDALERKEDQAVRAKQTAERQALSAQSTANEKARAAALAELNAAERARAAANGRGPGGINPATQRAIDERERKARQALAKADEADAKILARQKVLDDIAAKQVANNAGIAAAEKQILDFENQRIVALTKIAELAEKQRLDAEKEAQLKKAQQEQAKTAADNLIKFKPEIDATNIAATDTDSTNDVEEIQGKAAAELQKQLAEFDRLAAEVRANAANFDVNARLQLEEQLAARKKAIEEKLQAELTNVTAAAIIQRVTLEKEALEKAAKESGQKVTDAMTVASTAASTLLGQLKAIRETLADQNGTTIGDTFLDTLESQITAAQKTGDLGQIEAVITNLFKVLEVQRRLIKTEENETLGINERVYKELTETRNIVEKMIANAGALRNAQKEVQAAQSVNAQVQEKINEAAKAWAAFTVAATEAEKNNKNVNLNIVKKVENTITRIQQLSAAYAALAAQINAANAAGGRPPVPKALGGMPFFAAGGQARQGLDLVNARLQQGEFVVNQRSTSRFYNQLVAMNSGREPRNFATGGNVTTVGDVNVTVQGGDSSEQTLQAIGKGINRQIRLNKLKLRG
jgi:hypothetical protein